MLTNLTLQCNLGVSCVPKEITNLAKPLLEYIVCYTIDIILQQPHIYMMYSDCYVRECVTLHEGTTHCLKTTS
jgi:hypothetical protein